MDKLLLDGFAYQFEEGSIRREGRAAPEKVVVLRITDEARGIEVEAWFGARGWEQFKADANGGVFIPARDTIERLGV